MKRLTYSSGPRKAPAIMLFFVLVLSPIVSRAAAPAPPKPPLMEQMRTLWGRQDDSGFLRQWLLCGEFPNPAGKGLTIDYLVSTGGEAAAAPVAGTNVRRPDGSLATWALKKADDDVIDLLKAFPGRATKNVVAYGYTVIGWPSAEKAVLSVGSDDGVRVWLNGVLVLDHAVRRGVTRDEDQVEVPMRAGSNSILVKVEQGDGGWGFCVRFLSRAKTLLMPRRGLTLGQLASDPGHPQRLGIGLGRTAQAVGYPESMATVEAVAAGGRIMATRKALCGSELSLDTTGWPPGAYDIRATTTFPNGAKSTAYMLWYRGSAADSASKLVVTADREDRNSQVGMVHRMLADLVLDRLGTDWKKLDPGKLPSIYSALMEWEELQMEEGEGGRRPNGFVRLAYRDPVDDSPQFCRAYLPPDYSPDRKWPMVVHLHGYNAGNPPYIQWGIDGRHHGWADNYGVIVLEPMGRYNTTYWGIGEKDVIRCINLAKQQLSVDDDRVYLVGESMGGGGCWYIGTRHPELFAALAPHFGGRDYHANLTADEAARLSPHDRWRVEARSMFVQAESLLTTPVFVNHGDQDDIVKVEYSRYAVRMLQRWGYNVRYWEHPGYGHGGYDADDEMMRWLLQQRRVAYPPRVRLRAAEVTSASAHWVRVEQCQDPWQLINVDAEFVAPNVLRLDTENVGRITLSPGNALIDPERPVQIVWNRTDLRTVDLGPGSITLDAAGYTSPLDAKTPQRFGRWDDVFRTPYALVVGTTSTDPTMRAFVQRTADQLEVWWKQWQHVKPRVFRDVDLTAEDQAKYSLVLIGGPTENAVSSRMAADLPLRVTPEGFSIDGHWFPAADSLAQMVYRHPLNPDRYVAILAPNSSAGMFLADRLPANMDFAILDRHVFADPDERPARRLWVTAGLFDNGWRYNDSFTDPGDPIARARGPLRKIPTILSAGIPARRLLLSDLLETASEGTFAKMMRDLSWQEKPITLSGRRYSSGIAVATSADPCTVTYDLTGDGWRRFRTTIGIEDDAAKLTQAEKDNTLVQFFVYGDGKELYKSDMLHWNSNPIPLDLDIRGVKSLKLSIGAGSIWHNAALSVDWADARLER